MMFMICCRVTPCLAVSITMTSVVLRDGTSEGGWAEGDGDCATDATGTADRINGSNNVMDEPRSSVFRLLGTGSLQFRLPKAVRNLHLPKLDVILSGKNHDHLLLRFRQGE